MKRLITIVSLLALLSACGPKNASTTSLAEIGEIPCDPFDLPDKMEIEDWTIQPAVNLREIKDGVNWIYLIGLSYRFMNDDKLMILSDDSIVSVKLCVSYCPAIWSDDQIVALKYTMLGSMGIKDMKIEEGKILLLESDALHTVPDHVLKKAASITKDELLTYLDEIGREWEEKYERENWPAEKKMWTRCINQYEPGDFVNKEKEGKRFGVYPDVFYVQLLMKGKKGEYVINLCHKETIGM